MGWKYGDYTAGFLTGDGDLLCVYCAETAGLAYGVNDPPVVTEHGPVIVYSVFEESQYPPVCANFVEAYWGRIDWCEQVINAGYIDCCSDSPDCGFSERHDWLSRDLPKPVPPAED